MVIKSYISPDSRVLLYTVNKAPFPKHNVGTLVQYDTDYDFPFGVNSTVGRLYASIFPLSIVMEEFL
jgi:hypothetical protein